MLLLLLLSRCSVESDSVRPHRWQSTRLPHPWDSPGKNTGVGCHFLLQCMKVKSESEVGQSCPTLSDPMDCSPPGSCVHGIFQARVLEWGAIAFSCITWLLLLSRFSRVRLCATPQTPYWSGKSFPLSGSLCLRIKLKLSDGEGNGNPLQYSCLENPMD